jgi:hypothetical protein
MASMTTINFKIALRDIAIASFCLALNVALGACTDSQRIGGVLPRTRAPATPRQFRRFTSLPVEIREMIYEHGIRSGGHFAAPTSVVSRAARTSYVLHNQIPAACFTNTVERLVAASVFIRNFSFFLTRESDAARMAAWLEQFGDRPDFCSVNSMQLNYVPSNRHQSLFYRIQLAQRCPGLRILTISIPLNEISVFSHVTKTRLQFDSLLRCGQLRKVNSVISDRNGFQYVAQSVRAATFKSLLQGIATEFEGMYGRALGVRVDVSDNNGRILGRLP